MSHRPQRVGELIRREAAAIIERTFVFSNRFVTLHHAECAPDLKNCTIFTGVLGGTDAEAQVIIDKLNKSRGQIQRDLYKRVKLKNSPQLYFKLDRSAERGVRMINLIEELPAVADDATPLGDFVGRDGLDHRWEETKDSEANEP